IATSSAMWAMQVPILSRRFRVHAIDLPGYGASAGLDGRTDGLDGRTDGLAGYADAVVATLDALDIRSAMIVGVSFGGMIAQRMAIDHSSRVR
ncbi:alpha/beta fold hydrolase, partial [Klebsiella pneumoniae]|uniref:alpha/beta fold hydrolase n=1 Tax=Klebsiella pneumoniae TaxID=573 RepID=UPI003013C2E7